MVNHGATKWVLVFLSSVVIFYITTDCDTALCMRHNELNNQENMQEPGQDAGSRRLQKFQNSVRTHNIMFAYSLEEQHKLLLEFKRLGNVVLNTQDFATLKKYINISDVLIKSTASVEASRDIAEHINFTITWLQKSIENNPDYCNILHYELYAKEYAAFIARATDWLSARETALNSNEVEYLKPIFILSIPNALDIKVLLENFIVFDPKASNIMFDGETLNKHTKLAYAIISQIDPSHGLKHHIEEVDFVIESLKNMLSENKINRCNYKNIAAFIEQGDKWLQEIDKICAKAIQLTFSGVNTTQSINTNINDKVVDLKQAVVVVTKKEIDNVDKIKELDKDIKTKLKKLRWMQREDFGASAPEGTGKLHETIALVRAERDVLAGKLGQLYPMLNKLDNIKVESKNVQLKDAIEIYGSGHKTVAWLNSKAYELLSKKYFYLLGLPAIGAAIAWKYYKR